MSEIPEQAAPDVQDQDPQELIAKLREENERQKNSILKLEDKRTQALDETKRLKRVKGLLGSIGIDHEAENAETLLAEKLLGAQAAIAEPSSTPDAGTDSNAASKPGPDPLVEAQMKRMAAQIEELSKANAIAEEEKAQAIAKNRADRIERQVVEALQKAGAANPSHAYRLMALDNKYRVDLTEEGAVVGGPDYDPKPLSEVVAAFKDDDSFSYMFVGTGITGAGTGARASTPTGGSSNNPFRTDQLNLTQAAVMLQNNPEKARRLVGEARSAGKLEPKLASLVRS